MFMRIFFLFLAFLIFFSRTQAQNSSSVVLEENNLTERFVDILLIDNTKTKAGRDFYEEIYRNWQNILSDTTEVNLYAYLTKINDDLIVIIEESPGMGNTTIVSLTVDDLLIWRQNLQPKADLIEFLAENAILYITDYVLNYAEYMEQLKNEDENGTF